MEGRFNGEFFALPFRGGEGCLFLEVLIFRNFTVCMKERQYVNNIIDSFFNYCLTTDCFYLYRGGEVRLPSFLHISL